MITVAPSGDSHARLMIIGEQPGEREARTGVVFHPWAAVGKELTRYLHQVLRLDREQVWLTNLIPEYLDGREITRADIKRWEPELLKQIADVKPEVIMTLGREATRYFLGDVNMDQVYALPHRWPVNSNIIIVPNYLRLYDADLQPLVWYGFDQCARVLRGEISCHEPRHPAEEQLTYTEFPNDPFALQAVFELYPAMAIDTEGLQGNPWGLSFSVQTNTAAVLHADTEIRQVFANLYNRRHPHVVMQGALHDLPILREMGIEITKFDDTQIMAFLLCLEPIGLKELAYRYRGIERESYLEVIGPASKKLALDWLQRAALVDWGPAKEELIFEGDTVKISKPWSVNRRIDGIIGIRTGEIRMAGTGFSKKILSIAKKALEQNGVGVGKINATKDGWIDCRVPLLSWTRINPELYILDALSPPEPAEDPRARWEALTKDMEDTCDRIEREIGVMPEAGLDALEQVFGDEGRKKATDYSAGDADDTLTIYPILSAKIDEMGLRAAYDLDISVIPMIDRMMHVGFGADRAYFQELGRELAVEMEKDLDLIESAIGNRINPNSPKQVGTLLFDRLKLPVQQYTETKQPSTADEVIEALRLISDHPVLPLISDYRELSKMKGTYADKLWRWLHDDGRIHPKLRITRVPSGRLACSEPNLMAIPVRSQRLLNGRKLGKAVRDGFRAGPGRMLGSWDLDQIEMRVLAHRSEDPRLIEVFLTGADIHAMTASLVFGLPISECGKGTWQRDAAKAIGFGIVYGITASGLQLQLKLLGIQKTEEECQAMIDAYLIKAYPMIRRLMEQRKAEARRYGYVRSQLGRIRYLPGIHSTNNKLRSEAERVCLNHDIQTTAQEVVKVAMAGIWTRVLPAFWAEGHYCEALLQVHDELILEFDEDIWEPLDIMVRNEMSEAIRLTVPVGAKGSMSPTWGGLK